MKNTIILFLFAAILSGCVSVKKYNANLDTEFPAEKLKEDVDYAYKNLKKLHPNLYWYISKDSLDDKFDSLKTSLIQPMKPSVFFQKLAPVIAQVREGHLRLVPPSKKYTKKELKALKNQKGLFGRMNYVVENDRLFVKDNADKFEGIKVGTEILKIKGIPVKDYLNRYRQYITGDGYNTTFLKYGISRRWADYFTVENGILDSVKIETSYQNEIKEFYIHREKKSKDEQKIEKKQRVEIRKSETKKTKDYNPTLRDYNRDMVFMDADSSIAYMKIKTFSGTYSRKFYRESFARLQKNKTKYLILDVRDNLGGSLSEIHNLYSYLALDRFRFIKDIEVTKRNSLLHAEYVSQVPTLAKPLACLTYPLYVIGSVFSVKKRNGKYLLRNNNIFSIKKPKKNAFKGKIYLLINGSSFSASSIIASKLKNDKRAVLVGEETGGTNDGTVAGRYSIKKLPNTKMYLPIWIMLVQPDIEFTHTQKGVTPDIEIVPNLNDILEKKDIQLNRVMEEIKK